MFQMDQNNSLKKIIHNAYIVFSGIYISYSFMKYVKRQIRNKRNSLAKTEIMKYVKSKQKINDEKGDQNSETNPKKQQSRRSSESLAEENQQNQRKMKSNTSSGIGLLELDTSIPKEIVKEKRRKIIKVCLTGGPCAGKTSGLAFLSEKLKDDNFDVYVVPEVATLISNGGGMINISGFSDDDIIQFQKSLMSVQISLEENFQRLAEISQNQSIILCDRGLIDGKAFMSDAGWQNLLKEMKLSEHEIRDKRYDFVIHLVTAADGAADYYVKEGARYQDIDQAVEIDKIFQKCWLGHQRLEIIDNKSVSSFEEKLEKLLFTVRRMSGVPVKGTKLYSRYIIIDPQSHPNIPEDFPVESFEIEDTFLYKVQYDENKGKLTKIRKRVQNGDVIYLCSESHIIDGKQTIYYKKRLNYREYVLVKDREDRDRITLRKFRRQFVYQGYYYILDKYLDYDMCILRAKNSPGSDDKQIIIPDFIQIDADVTEYKEFRSLNLSLKSSPLRDKKFLEELVYTIQDQQKNLIKFEDKLRPRPNRK
ncbi:hypothetical protein ABPG72_007852 [Tetrahymena utriculariae]